MSKIINILNKLSKNVNNNKTLQTKIAASLGMIAASKYLNIQVPIYFKDIIDNTEKITKIYSNELINLDGNIIPYLIAGYGITKISAYGFHELRNLIFTTVSDNAIRNISSNIILNILRKDIHFHNDNKVGHLITTLKNGNKSIRYLLNSVVFNIIPLCLEITLVSNILIKNYNYKFTLITLGTVAIYSIYTIYVTNWRSRFLKEKIRLEKEKNSILADIFINYENVKYFDNDIYETNRYISSLEKFQLSNQKIFRSLSILNFGQNVIFSSALSGCLYYSYYEVINMNMTVGDIVLINGLLLQLITPLNFLGSLYRDTNQAIIDCDNIFALMDNHTNKYPDISAAINLKSNNLIVFDNVSFGYDNPLIKNLSFAIEKNSSNAIEKNSSNAIIGNSGSGKSSIFKLLYRLYKPQEGNIYIDNININTMTNSDIHKYLSIIPQDNILFNENFRYNILYSIFNRYNYVEVEELIKSSMYDREIIEHMRNLRLERFLLHDRYREPIGEKGSKLSGGEKQRLCIIRCLIQDKNIILADEPFSALDMTTEKTIADYLYRDRTTLVITHDNNIDIFDNVIDISNNSLNK